MSRSTRFDCEMRTSLPATLEAVEEFFVEFRRRSQLMLEWVNCFTAELLVREALTNAVVHGCHADPAKRVRCSLRLRSRCLLIAVEDDGDGFDWRAARSTMAEATECSGRGLQILFNYANRVRFSEKGNVVTMLKRIGTKENIQ